MKAWLKGGLIGLGIEIILGLIMFITPIFNKIIGAPVMIGYSLCSYLIQCSGENCFSCFYINLALSPIIWFIIGAIIGLIIGKLKSKNQFSQKKTQKKIKIQNLNKTKTINK